MDKVLTYVQYEEKKNKVIILDCMRIFVNEVRVLSFLSPYSVDRCSSIETHSATSTINLSLLVFREKKNGIAKKLVDTIVFLNKQNNFKFPHDS